MFVPIVLTTILTNEDKQYMIYVDIPAIYEFFAKLKLPSNVVLQKYPAYVSPYKYRQWRKDVRLVLNNIDVESLTFYHTEFGEVANWIISQYSTKVPVYFQSPFNKFPYQELIGFKAFKLRMINKLFYNADVNILDAGNRCFASMSETFYKKNNVIRLEPKIDNKLVADFVCSQIKVKENSSQDVVLVSGGNIQMGYISEPEWNSLLEQIVNRIGHEKIVVKFHPRFNDLCEMEKSLWQVPSFIPGNVFIPLFDCYIGLMSTMLNDAANEGKMAISVLNLLDIEEKQKNIFKSALNNKEIQGKVLFPNSIDELVEYVFSALEKQNIS